MNIKKRIERLESQSAAQDDDTILIRDEQPGDPRPELYDPREGSRRLAKIHRLKKPPVIIWDLPETPAEMSPDSRTDS